MPSIPFPTLRRPPRITTPVSAADAAVCPTPSIWQKATKCGSLIPLLFNPFIGVTPLTRHIVRCHAGVATLLRRHGNVVTPAWQRCYAGMATLLCRHGNVVMPAWQPTKRHVRTGSSPYVLDSWGIRTAFQNVKRVKLSPAFAARWFCQNERLLKIQG